MLRHETTTFPSEVACQPPSEVAEEGRSTEPGPMTRYDFIEAIDEDNQASKFQRVVEGLSG